MRPDDRPRLRASSRGCNRVIAHTVHKKDQWHMVDSAYARATQRNVDAHSSCGFMEKSGPEPDPILEPSSDAAVQTDHLPIPFSLSAYCTHLSQPLRVYAMWRLPQAR
eukprot:1036087-Amphidinium_carterae.2